MKVALLINERMFRVRLARAATEAGATVDEYATASTALVGFAAHGYDLIAMDWKVYPGASSPDQALNDLAAMIPKAEYNINLLYWEVALHVLDAVRAEDSPNRTAPVLLRCPAPAPPGFEAGDELERDSMESDLARRAPVEALYGASVAEFASALTRRLGA